MSYFKISQLLHVSTEQNHEKLQNIWGHLSDATQIQVLMFTIWANFLDVIMYVLLLIIEGMWYAYTVQCLL
jgi:hypothetical protein